MGAALIGLGLALAQPKRKVLVITGDGEMLMNLGSLATIAVEAPPNLTVAVLDNERFGETGMPRPTPPPASTSRRWLPRSASAPRELSGPWLRSPNCATSPIRGAAPPFPDQDRAGSAGALMSPADGVILTSRFRQLAPGGDEALYN